MGKVVAIAVGVVAFLAVLSAGNIAAAAVFGILMFAMAYGLFAWRPGDTTPPKEMEAAGNAPQQASPAATQDDTAAKEHLVACAYALQLEQMGLPEAEARAATSKLVAETAADLRERGLDLFKSNQGDEYVTREAFCAPRLEAGLTLEDIRDHWNRPLLSIFTEVRMRELTNFVYADIARQQGRDLAVAGDEYKKNFPRYGDPNRWDAKDKFNQGLRPQDADIYPEFAARVDSWRRRAGDAAVAAEINVHGTLNAAVRALVSAEKL